MTKIPLYGLDGNKIEDIQLPKIFLTEYNLREIVLNYGIYQSEWRVL